MPTNARRVIDAFLTGDAPSAVALLATDATFHSPIRDYTGADRIGSVWQAVAGVVTHARPTSVHERDGETIAFFAGAIKGQPIDGVLRTLTDDENRVTDITLMVRPWDALKSGIADIKPPPGRKTF
jgi:SnoaL-like domain